MWLFQVIWQNCAKRGKSSWFISVQIMSLMGSTGHIIRKTKQIPSTRFVIHCVPSIVWAIKTRFWENSKQELWWLPHYSRSYFVWSRRFPRKCCFVSLQAGYRRQRMHNWPHRKTSPHTHYRYCQDNSKLYNKKSSFGGNCSSVGRGIFRMLLWNLEGIHKVWNGSAYGTIGRHLYRTHSCCTIHFDSWIATNYSDVKCKTPLQLPSWLHRTEREWMLRDAVAQQFRFHP